MRAAPMLPVLPRLASPLAAGPRFDAPGAPAAPDADVLEEVETESRLGFPWKVLLFDDDIHTFDEVIAQLIKATGCTYDRGHEIANTVHNEGKAVAFEGEFAECFRVQGVLREIGLVTQIEG